jgi:hypothetical protein
MRFAQGTIFRLSERDSLRLLELLSLTAKEIELVKRKLRFPIGV